MQLSPKVRVLVFGIAQASSRVPPQWDASRYQPGICRIADLSSAAVDALTARYELQSVFPPRTECNAPLYNIANTKVSAVVTGITLSCEQIRNAPVEIRRWIEHELATSLGFQVQACDSQPQFPQPVGCSHDELVGVLSGIQGVFPAVNVFFELGRKGISFAQDRLEAYRLSETSNIIPVFRVRNRSSRA